MICEACRERRHSECRGGTWCDCQHKPPATEPPTTEPPATEPHDDQSVAEPAEQPTDEPPEDGGSEPRVNWLRQG
ncbi:MAG: hypothetical protein ACRDP6_43065 [Actinoallomurus sp.]